MSVNNGRNIITTCLLTLSNGVFRTSVTIVVVTSALVGQTIAPSDRLATLPAALMIIGSMIGVIPIGNIMAHLGRRAGMFVGSAMGILGGVMSTLSVGLHHFWMFCLGLFLLGVYGASAQFYRFAAGEAIGPKYRNRAISAVLLGGVFAAYLGPIIATNTRDHILSAPYQGSYLGLLIITSLSVLFISGMYFPAKPKMERKLQNFKIVTAALVHPQILAKFLKLE